MAAELVIRGGTVVDGTGAPGRAGLAERAGVPAAGVVAFGARPNALPMLAWAGRAVAVAIFPRRPSAPSRVLKIGGACSTRAIRSTCRNRWSLRSWSLWFRRSAASSTPRTPISFTDWCSRPFLVGAARAAPHAAAFQVAVSRLSTLQQTVCRS